MCVFVNLCDSNTCWHHARIQFRRSEKDQKSVPKETLDMSADFCYYQGIGDLETFQGR